uniref:mitochondrial potassium channel n=1 Tax=Doryrhamphus excisus TaxID=161450 RepID=UPI0025AEAEC1|nr:mitochondrial potassium channel [Doryrhamphus excisus]
MRYKVHGSCCLSRLFLLGPRLGQVCVVRTYSAQHQPSGPKRPDGRDGPETLKKRALSALQHAGQLGQQWGQRSAQMMSATMNSWWERYEEFVGLNEVRHAQTKVTEAEAAFMVSRGMVREAHGSLEALLARLKEVRDRLDRVSREEAHYLELATLEHKLLQEERRLRTSYECTESSEREKFALFSAAVRESHEKERTRAERTKNWSIIGSVLGALIGVMGSTYINRVRLQELKGLLLEAQKGPESLQEALKVQAGNHRSQQDELRALIDTLRVTINDPKGPSPASPIRPSSTLSEVRSSNQRTESLMQSLLPQVGQLQQGLAKVHNELCGLRNLLETALQARRETPERPVGIERAGADEVLGSESMFQTLEDTQRTLGERISRSTLYNATFTYTATAITIAAVYILLRGGS